MKPRKDPSRRPMIRKDARSTLTWVRSETHPIKKKLLLLGYITNAVEKKGESLFLVGGEAVEVYTAGQFTTGDVDITTTNRKATEKALAKLGFTEAGMVWLNGSLGVAFHIVGFLPSEGVEKARTFRAGPYRVHVLSVEGLIVDRLAAAKFWKSERDLEQAKILQASFAKSLDGAVLMEKARRRGVADYLARLRRVNTSGTRVQTSRKIREQKTYTLEKTGR